MKRIILAILLLCLLAPLALAQEQGEAVIPADQQTSAFLPLLRGKRVALFANHTATVNGQHLLDLLLEKGVNVTAIFSPEHGFRGTASAGEHVSSSVDSQTGIPILSLYDGRSLSPSAQSMQKFDILVADIQDVGLRFYTYYISLARLMAACANHQKPLVVLDRPNPNGHMVDGPLLDMKHKSGVGAFPIPVMHGLTLGELMLMANDKGWAGGKRCDLTVILCSGYSHATHWRIDTPPSPNLPNMTAIYLYPSLCYFEATPVSVGRGTDLPFQQYGHPDMKGYAHTFTPQDRPGAANPPQEGKLCRGADLSAMPDSTLWQKGVDLTYLIDAYNRMGRPAKFFTSFFEKLIGVDYVRRMIEQGHSADEIRARWANDVERFKEERKPYLLYPEN